MNEKNKVEIYCLLEEDLEHFSPTFKIRNQELLTEHKENLEIEIHSFDEKPFETLKLELTDYISSHLKVLKISSNLDKRYDYWGPNKNSLEDIKKYVKFEKEEIEGCKISNTLKITKHSNAGNLAKLMYSAALVTEIFFSPTYAYFLNQESDLKEGLLIGTFGASFFAAIGIYTQISGYIRGKKNLKALNQTLKQYTLTLENINLENTLINVHSEAKELYDGIKLSTQSQFMTPDYGRINEALMEVYQRQ